MFTQRCESWTSGGGGGGSQQMRDAALVRLNIARFGKRLGVWMNMRALMHWHAHGACHLTRFTCYTHTTHTHTQVLFTRLQHMDTAAADFSELFAVPAASKLRKMTETSFEEGKQVGIAFLSNLVQCMSSAGAADLPVESRHVSTVNFHTSDWVAPTLTGSKTTIVKNHEVGACAFAALPQCLNLHANNPTNAPRSVSGCQQPGCAATTPSAQAIVRTSCGHWACPGCTALGCLPCRSSLVHAFRLRGSWVADNEKFKHLPISRTRMSKIGQGGPPRVVPPAAHGGGGSGGWQWRWRRWRWWGGGCSLFLGERRRHRPRPQGTMPARVSQRELR